MITMHMKNISTSIILILFLYTLSFSGQDTTCSLEQKFIKHGLINIYTVDSTIQVDLMYASDSNLFGKPMYGCLKRCYLQPEAAHKVSKAQKELKKLQPNYSLLILDGGRPRSVQQKMWNLVKDTPLQSYVANPARGSMHNYGAAVDITIIDENGNELDMGNPDPRTNILGKNKKEIQDALNAVGLTEKQKANRTLLKNIMRKAGFKPLSFEWWHFNAFEKDIVRKRYNIIE